MASAKDENKGNKNGGAVVAEDDLSRFAGVLPEGFKADGLRKIGTLTPLWLAKQVVLHRYPSCVGFPIGLKLIELKHEQDPAKRWTRNLVVVLAQPAVGCLGNQVDGYEPVMLKSAQRIIVPVSGALKNAEELMAAAMDPDNVYLTILEAWSDSPKSRLGVTGRLKPMPGRNPMQEIDTFLHIQPTKREGMFLFDEAEVDVVGGEEEADPTGAPSVPALGAGGVKRGEIVNKAGQPARAVG